MPFNVNLQKFLENFNSRFIRTPHSSIMSMMFGSNKLGELVDLRYRSKHIIDISTYIEMPQGTFLHMGYRWSCLHRLDVCHHEIQEFQFLSEHHFRPNSLHITNLRGFCLSCTACRALVVHIRVTPAY